MRFVFILVSLLTLGLSACATTPVNLADTKIVTVEKVSSEHTEISDVTVHQHGDKVEIDVMIKPKERVRWFVAGTITIEVKEPSGNTFEVTLSQARRDHPTPGHKTQHAHFITFLPFVLEPGTVVRVTHHP